MKKKTLLNILYFVYPILGLVISLLGFFIPMHNYAKVMLVFICILFVLSFLSSINEKKRQKELKKDLAEVIQTLSRRLARALSSFSAGDISYQVTRLPGPPVTEEAKPISELLLTGIQDFNSITNLPSNRLCFVGAGGYQEGKVAGENIAKILGGKGSYACFIPAFTQTNHVLRMKGCVDYLSEHFPNIKSYGVFEPNGSPEYAGKILEDLIKKHPDLSLLYVTDGHTPSGIGEVIRKLNLPNFKFIVFDGIKENFDMLKEGVVTAIIEQSPYSQTYNAVMHLYNACEASWKPLSKKLYMDPIYIDIDNYQTYWDDESNKRVMRENELAQLVSPEPNRSKRPYRFAVLMPQLTGFFAGLLAGIEGAIEVLKKFNVSIEVIDLYHNQEEFGSAKYYVPEIERLVQERYDGFTTSVIDENIIPAINAAIKAGLKVTTFSTEPSNFREIVVNIVENIEQLTCLSQSLATAAEESSRANLQINNVIKGLNEDISEQKMKIDDNDTRLSDLNQMIHEVQTALEGYVKLVEEVTYNSREGDTAISNTYAVTVELKDYIDKMESELTSFNEKLDMVRSFAVTIENISDETNVLAINASIQAARAGTAGQAFAIVAGEVRSLAEKSRVTAESINKMVGDITESMGTILEITNNSTSGVVKNIEQARFAQRSFLSIRDALQNVEGSIEKIKNSVAGVVLNSATVKQNMSSIDQMSNNSVNRIEELSISINELSVQGQHLSQTANELKVMAEDQGSVFSQLDI